MSTPIEDYGIIGNTYTAALVSREGSIDWLCLPRFDSESVFAALLGGPEHGRWLITPADRLVRLSRYYRGETGILETRFETPEGNARIVDFMALSEEGEDQVDLIRLVYGEKGRVRMRTRSSCASITRAAFRGYASISAARWRSPARTRSSSSPRWRCAARPK
jgi:GH15 family glucan-1,4-alpha-glucosidase